MELEATLKTILAETRIVAILRGVEPTEVVDIASALYDAGIRIVEVPLNSPEPFKSIEAIAKAFSGRLIVGAGTVLDPDDVNAVRGAGGTLIVSPNMNPWVIERTKTLGLVSAPGVATPSEAFTGISAGADVLKAFPAEMLPPKIVKAWRAVLPPEVPVVAVGGITPETMAAYLEAGAAGFGIGSSLYKPGRSAEDVSKAAEAFIAAL